MSAESAHGARCECGSTSEDWCRRCSRYVCATHRDGGLCDECVIIERIRLRDPELAKAIAGPRTTKVVAKGLLTMLAGLAWYGVIALVVVAVLKWAWGVVFG